MSSRVTTVISAACGGLVVIGSVLGGAIPAQAHNYLVSSTPAADSTLTALPDQFEITTNEDLLDTDGASAAFALQVTDVSGAYYGDGCVSVDGPSMVAEPALGEAGTYTVIWQVVSADGHTVSDEFEFDWAPSSPTAISSGVSAPPECGGAAPSDTAAGEDQPDAGQPDAGQADSRGAATTATSDAGSIPSDALWLGGGAVILIGAFVAVLIARRRRSSSE